MFEKMLRDFIMTGMPDVRNADGTRKRPIDPIDVNIRIKSSLEIGLVRLLKASGSGTMQSHGDSKDHNNYRSVACGKDYGVRIGDVYFGFQFRDYDPYSISVSIDNVSVMSTTVDGPIEKQMDSSELDAHVDDAAHVLLGRRSSELAQREVRDRKYDLEREDKANTVAHRFGATRTK